MVIFVPYFVTVTTKQMVVLAPGFLPEIIHRFMRGGNDEFMHLIKMMSS